MTSTGSSKYGDTWFGELVKRYVIEDEIVELVELKNGEMLPGDLWETSVCAPLLGWLAACNCVEEKQRRQLLCHVAKIVRFAVAQTKERHGVLGLERLTRELDSREHCLVVLGKLVTRVGEAIDYLGRIEYTIPGAGTTLAIHRLFPHNVSMAIYDAESVMSLSFMLANPDGPICGHSFEDEIRENLAFDSKRGIVLAENCNFVDRDQAPQELNQDSNERDSTR